MSVLRGVERFCQQAVVAAAFSAALEAGMPAQPGVGAVGCTVPRSRYANSMTWSGLTPGVVGGALSDAFLRQEGLGQQERSRGKFRASVTGDALESYQQAVGTCAGDRGAVSC